MSFFSERPPSSSDADDTQKREQQQKQQQQKEEARQNMLMQVLASDARARLTRISLIKPTKARQIEDMLLGAIQRGALRGGTGEGGKISEQDLLQLLEQVERQERSTDQGSNSIKFQRRDTLDDEEDQELDALLAGSSKSKGKYVSEDEDD